MSAAAIPIRKLALVDARTGAIDTRFADRRIPSEAPSTNTGIVADGRGGWFATSPTGVVRLLHDGRIDSSWHGRIGGSAVSLTRFGATIYVGLQPKPNAFRLAALDAGTGNLRWESAVYSGRQLVTLAADDAGIFAGGTMPKPGASDIGREYSPWLMRFDPRTGASRSFDVPGNGTEVDAIALAGNRVYVGGVLGSPHPLVVALDERTGAVLPWQPRGLTFADDADSIAVASNQVIIGGTFGFGAFDSKTGAKLPWSRQVDGSPVVVAVAGDRVYLGGNVRSSFKSVDRHKTNNLAAYDLRLHRWTSWAPNLAKYTSVAAIVPSGGTVLVAGGFSASLG